MNRFSSCEKKIERADIVKVEDKLSIHLPEDFVLHYLQFNGGIPEKSWWDSEDEFEPVEVACFKPFVYNSKTNNDPRSLIDGCYISMLERDVIPKNLLPFANDWGGNFFCIDLDNYSIIYYATDSFDEDLTMQENHVKLQRFLTNSFDNFVNGLVKEEDLT
ncbi:MULTISPECIES: SMI1/KNR4 family protein [Enterobacter]|uniref:SMI1/KNR4 family protein n=1 Tax=Enterobacter TaxID=547 RepID=UPI000EB501ED|nr:SMI1/KNR4 family protein [Enterobacter ludwigii]EKS7197717.1 SMI1/KNR4 family protein [Enterobacter ludwigii]MCE2009448.1 SMI1/KNR4 family protein [Enterobacter ludwigii]WNI75233.1 SMI1/KNR4 family protein [Enterobacter ludwigii]HDR2455838.1 SMI1/KNR4 family protein [Enterobacter ludwigii]